MDRRHEDQLRAHEERLAQLVAVVDARRGSRLLDNNRETALPGKHAEPQHRARGDRF
jgi:hypothetical protein